jgi:hypothetical protein
VNAATAAGVATVKIVFLEKPKTNHQEGQQQQDHQQQQ